MTKGGGSALGKGGGRIGKMSGGPPGIGTTQLRAGPGLSKSRVNTKGPASGSKKAASALPQGRGGKAI